jgi:PAS domain S-box-containing protein
MGLFRTKSIRKYKERQFRQSHDILEKKVQQRTAELVEANKKLRQEIEHRQHAEKALRESQTAIQALIDASPEPTMLVDSKGVVLTINEIGAQRMGKSRQGIIGATAFDFFPPEVAQDKAEKLKQVLASGKPVRFADEHSGRHYYNSHYPVFDTDGNVKNVAIFAQDLTMQHQAELALRGSEEKFRTLFESCPVGIGVGSLDGKVLAYNDAAIRITGYTGEELSRLNLRDIYCTPEERTQLLQRFQTEGFIRDAEVKIRRKDSTTIYVKKSISPFELDGKMVLLTVFEDITEHKRNEEMLKSANRLLSSTFDALQDLVVVIDKDFRVVTSNWTDHAYISKKERQENPFCYAAFMQRKTPCEDCHAQEVFATGEIKVFEQTNPLDGQTREIQVVPIFDDRKKVAMVVEHLRNITKRKQAEARIRSLSQQLIKAQEDERQIISRELHDRVAQDLSTLKIGLDTLYHNEPTVSPEVQQKILKLSEIALNSIRAVRDLSYELHLPGLDGMGLIPALSMYCEEFAEKSGLQVDFRATGVSALRLDFDTEMNLYRLIQEGLNNIRKHAAANRANIKFVGAYPNIILRIEDDGKGFDLEERARTAGSEKRMGLRSMAERVSLMQGEMKIQSQPMKGTQIIIKFPFRENKRGSKENHIDRR